MQKQARFKFPRIPSCTCIKEGRLCACRCLLHLVHPYKALMSTFSHSVIVTVGVNDNESHLITHAYTQGVTRIKTHVEAHRNHSECVVLSAALMADTASVAIDVGPDNEIRETVLQLKPETVPVWSWTDAPTNGEKQVSRVQTCT